MDLRRVPRSSYGPNSQDELAPGRLAILSSVEVTQASHRFSTRRPTFCAYQSDCSKISAMAASLKTSPSAFTPDELAPAGQLLNLSCESPLSLPRFSVPSPPRAVPVRDSPSGALCLAGSAPECIHLEYPNHPMQLGLQHTLSGFQEARCSVKSLPYIHFMTDYEGHFKVEGDYFQLVSDCREKSSVHNPKFSAGNYPCSVRLRSAKAYKTEQHAGMTAIV